LRLRFSTAIQTGVDMQDFRIAPRPVGASFFRMLKCVGW